MNRSPERAGVIRLPFSEKSNHSVNDREARIISFRLPSHLHQGNEIKDKRSKRYDLSAAGLNEAQVIAMTEICNGCYESNNPLLEEAADYAWHYGKNALINGAPLEEVVTNMQSLLSLAELDQREA